MDSFADAFQKAGVVKKEQNREPKPKKKFNAHPNIGYLFYKDYYRDIDFRTTNNKENRVSFEQKSKELIDKKLYIQSIQKVETKEYFKLKTTSMGLLIGSGHIHETGEEGEFKLGFEFDYTTGLPIIRGSSVKGVLRSAFKHPEYIEEKLRELNIDNVKDVEKLEDEIFEGIMNNEHLPLSKRDIFFDAEIIGEKQRRFLADDFITPHDKDNLKNPVPLKFLKVLPDVIFEFKFKLNSNGSIDESSKEKLFKSIILDLGLGAKTNVGFGQFEDF